VIRINQPKPFGQKKELSRIKTKKITVFRVLDKVKYLILSKSRKFQMVNKFELLNEQKEEKI
jgi:hypothetical protein